MIKKETRRSINTVLSSFIMTAIAMQLTSCNAKNNSSKISQTENSVTEKVLSDVSTSVTDSDITQKNKNGEYDVSYTEKELTYKWDDDCTIVSASDSGFKVEGSGASASGSTLNITSAGTYLMSGQINEGNIVVNTQDEKAVRLVFNGLSVNCSTTAPINVTCADKVIITLVNGTDNIVGDTARTVSDDGSDMTTGTIYSSSDLTFNGAGTLNVSAQFRDGIVSKDKLKFVSGDIKIKAVDDAIVGRDLVAVRDGKFGIESQGDGIKTTNDTDTEKGNVIIESGTFDIQIDKDGIQAENAVNIKDGTINITSGGGSTNGKDHTPNDMMGGGKRGFGGRGFAPDNKGDTETEKTDTVAQKTSMVTEDSDAAAEETSSGGKGIKSVNKILIDNGTVKINSGDDSIHSDDSVIINSGKINILSGDDGIHATEDVQINGGEICIEKSYEGLEGSSIKINDGAVYITASDDGVNASASDNSKEPMFVVNGGYVCVDASGDGLDSNGNIQINDGVVLVNGPVSNGDGPLDCGDNNNSIKVNGGVLVAAGSSGMFELPSSDSKQNSVAISSLSADAGTLCSLTDEKNNVIVAFKVSKTAAAMVISTPEIKKDNKYFIYKDGKYSGTLNDDGFAEGGTLSAGTEAGNCTVSSSVTTIGEFKGPMGGGGMPFANGEKPQKPQGGNRGDFVPDENFVPGQGRPDDKKFETDAQKQPETVQ